MALVLRVSPCRNSGRPNTNDDSSHKALPAVYCLLFNFDSDISNRCPNCSPVRCLSHTLFRLEVSPVSSNLLHLLMIKSRERTTRARGCGEALTARASALALADVTREISSPKSHTLLSYICTFCVSQYVILRLSSITRIWLIELRRWGSPINLCSTYFCQPCDDNE